MPTWNWEGEPRWSFVVDTNLYAGNFERELCAYVIGEPRDDEYGEHEYGEDEYLKMFDSSCSFDFKELSDQRLVDPGDDGYHVALVDIAPTPGWANDGKGNHYEVKGRKKFKYPAYQSVALFLTREPTKEELAELVKRAREFSALPPIHARSIRPTILGCRLVQETVQLVSTTVG